MYGDKALLTIKRLKISSGDILRFGDDISGYGYGHVLKSHTLQYIVIFEPIFPEDVNLRSVITSLILLSGWTADARFISGDWEMMGNIPFIGHFNFPEYKIEKSGQIWVTDNDGKLLRLATAKEAARLTFRVSHSPIAFEKAFWAHHGKQPWEHRFERLRAKNIN